MHGSRRTLVLFGVGIVFAALAALPHAAVAGTLAPDSPVSAGADDTKIAYVVMVVLGLVLALGVIGGLLAALRSGPSTGEAERRTRGTSGVQRTVGWSLAGLAVVVFVFGIIITDSASEVEPTGADGLLTAQTGIEPPTGDAQPLRIKVTGQQWLWRYEYPDGTSSYYEMVVPVDTAVLLDLGSVDVNHRWWVPALGGMFDAVPGLENTTWFKADEVGSYEGRSTAFSGPAYATMRARVNVVEPADYEIWLSDQAEGIQTAQAAVQERIESGTAPEEGVE